VLPNGTWPGRLTDSLAVSPYIDSPAPSGPPPPAARPLGDLLSSSHGPAALSALSVERTPILAIGSNAGVEQLARKFPPSLFPGAASLIPVVQCVLEDFDVVYAPLVSSYGSCTATLEYSPGTAVELFATLLDGPQLERMHATEGCYSLVELKNVRLHEGRGLGDTAGSIIRDRAYVYIHQLGTLYVPGAAEEATAAAGVAAGADGAESSPVALAEIRAKGRRYPALPQTEMQELVRGLFSGEGGGATSGTSGDAGGVNGAAAAAQLDAWIARMLTDEAERRRVVAALGERARFLKYPQHEVLQTLGSVHSDSVN
jgi:hypothetical protein